MSSSDLFVDGFPHGTPQGYDDGCRGGACPAGTEYGLSCKTAKLKSNGDRQYQQLAKRGATVAEIADALGFVGTETDAAPVVTQAKPKSKATPATAKGARTIADEPKPEPTAEPVVEEAAPETPEPPRMNGPRASSSTIATGNASGSTTTEEQPAAKPAEIRAWAIAKGYQVSTKGKLPQHIIDHYWEATGRLDTEQNSDPARHGGLIPVGLTIYPSAQTAAELAAGDVTGQSIEGKDVEQVVEHVEMCLVCRETGAVGFECGHPDAHAPIASGSHDANGEPAELATEDTNVADEALAALREKLSAPRPEWGQVAESVDVEAARSLAVRLEQELAHLQEQHDELDAAFAQLTRDFLERGAEVMHLVEQLAIAEQAAAAGETATRLALQKWAEERDRFVDLIGRPEPETAHPRRSLRDRLTRQR